MKKALILVTSVILLSSISIVFASLDYNRVENLEIRKIDSSLKVKRNLYKSVSGIMNQTKNLRQYRVVKISSIDL